MKELVKDSGKYLCVSTEDCEDIKGCAECYKEDGVKYCSACQS